jgi:hypothetical protein
LLVIAVGQGCSLFGGANQVEVAGHEIPGVEKLPLGLLAVLQRAPGSLSRDAAGACTRLETSARGPFFIHHRYSFKLISSGFLRLSNTVITSTSSSDNL